MFLILIRRIRREEHGSALAAVIGVMAVGLILTSLIMASVVGGIGFTSAARAGVQSQAAADAGVSVALAGLQKPGNCAAQPTPGVYESDSPPAYRVQVFYPNGAGGWRIGCPPSAGVDIRVVSTGFAEAPGSAGRSGSDVSAVEAVFRSDVTPPTINPSGPAIFAYTSNGFSGSGKLVSVDGSSPSVLVREGNVSCTGGAAMNGDFVVNNGNLLLAGSCGVNGNLWSSGSTRLEGGVKVGGNVVAKSLDFVGGTVGGRSWTDGNTKVSWGSTINSGATAQTLTLAGGNIKGSAWARGAASWTVGGGVIDGSLTAQSLSGSGTVRGGTTLRPAGPGAGTPAPSTPVVPNWVDFDLVPADWSGYRVKAVSGSCGWDVLQAAANGFAGSPGIIDARTCSGPITISDYQKLNLTSDTAIFAKTFTLGGSSGFTSTSPARLWLVTPDSVPNGALDCPTSGGTTLTGGFSFGANVSAMIYSPCRVNIGSSINFRGQVFSGSAAIDGNATLGYVPLGLPGVDLSTGIVGDPSKNAELILQSRRNVTPDGATHE